MTQSGGAIGDYSSGGKGPAQTGPQNCSCGHSISRYHVRGATVCMYLTEQLACGGPCGKEEQP